MQQAIHSPTHSEDGVYGSSREELALRKKKERAHTTALWVKLESVTPRTRQEEGKLGNRSKSLRSGRTKEQVLQDASNVVMSYARVTGSRMHHSLAGDDCGVGLMVVQLDTGKIIHASRGFLELGSWLFDGLL
jgi:hypothetical protein